MPPPGGPRQLAATVARIFSRPLDRAHPLWELYLIHGVEGGRVAMLTKVHHAAVDGMSGNEILGVLLDPSPEGREVEPPPPRSTDREPSQVEMLARGLAGLPLQPVRAFGGLPRILGAVEDLPGVAAVPGGRTVARMTTRVLRRLPGRHDGEILDTVAVRAPNTRFNSPISPHRRYAFASVSLDRVRAIKDALGITVNDVVLGVCATALRTWLLEHDELPEEPLVAMVPLSVRTAEQAKDFGNRVSAMFVPIPTDVEDPSERLFRAHETMRVAKERFRAVPADVLQDVTRFVPPALFARAARMTAQLGVQRLRPLNLVISNVPGSRTPLFFAGAELEAYYPVSVIADGVGLNITCISYRDHVDFGVVVDREQLSDAWELMDGIVAALEELDEVICGAGRSRRGDRARFRAREPEASPSS